MEALKALSENLLSLDAILNESQAEKNEIIGERVRAISTAKKLFDDFFTEIEALKEVEKIEEDSNPVI